MRIFPALALSGARLAAATVVAARLAASPAETKPALPFIENDYPAALAQARAKKLPIFADAWAPW